MSTDSWILPHHHRFRIGATIIEWYHHKRRILRALLYLACPLFIAQALAFVSFIYEESIQATGFAVHSALQAGDPYVASECIRTFEATMRAAQDFQTCYGWMAFWADNAYHRYFYSTAPAQLVSYHSEGVKRRLWKPDARRWQWLTDPHNGKTGWVDTWKLDPIGKMLAAGFHPDYIPGYWERTRGVPGEDERTYP